MSSAPKLHHYVPQMLLRRFAEDPSVPAPVVFRLDKGTGQIRRAGIRSEAAIKHHNRLHNVPERSPTFVEETLALSEGRAAEPIRKLIEGVRLTMMERLDVAFFLYFQQQRTPRGRAWQVFGQEQAAQAFMLQKLADPVRVQRFFEKRGDPKTIAEAEAWAAEVRTKVESGEAYPVVGHDREVLGMFMLADDVVPRIAAEFTYLTVRPSGEDRFIISDHPLSIYDPVVAPHRGVGWLSSERTEIAMPIDPATCFVLVRGLPSDDSVTADRALVQELNLRTYASAEWAIYGPTQALVQGVRALARRQRARLAQLAPRPPRIYRAQRFEDEEEPYAIRVLTAPPPQRGRRRPRTPGPKPAADSKPQS